MSPFRSVLVVFYLGQCSSHFRSIFVSFSVNFLHFHKHFSIFLTHFLGEIKSNQGWAEKENGPPLPNIILGLSILGPNIKNLIKSHGGSIPLATLKNCYEAEFEAFIVNNDEGVPLEHLVTAIHGINIQQNHSSGIKVLVANEEPNTIVEDLVIFFFFFFSNIFSGAKRVERIKIHKCRFLTILAC